MALREVGSPQKPTRSSAVWHVYDYHSWYMSDFAVKQDAIPGFINVAKTKVNVPGIYRGKCTELCGERHAYMPIVVKAVTQEEY